AMAPPEGSNARKGGGGEDNGVATGRIKLGGETPRVALAVAVAQAMGKKSPIRFMGAKREGCTDKRGSESAPRPATRPVSRVLDRTGRAVTSAMPATIKVLCQGPTANPAARNTRDMTQMAQPVCTTSSGQKCRPSPTWRNSPNTVERLGTR